MDTRKFHSERDGPWLQISARQEAEIHRDSAKRTHHAAKKPTLKHLTS
jgi:hypothetical protein